MSFSVCAEAASLCSILSEAWTAGLALDLSPELTRAVTNVICSLCFSSSYRRGDAEFEAMLHYSKGIVDTVAKDSLVDIFPWLQVGKHTQLSGQHRHLFKIPTWWATHLLTTDTLITKTMSLQCFIHLCPEMMYF